MSGGSFRELGGIIAAIALGTAIWFWITDDPLNHEAFQAVDDVTLKEHERQLLSTAARLRKIVGCMEQTRADCGEPAAVETPTIEPELETEL